jgi:hypothetical protein
MKTPVKMYFVSANSYRLRGSMLVMVAWCTVVLVLLFALALSIQYYFASDKNLQFTADQLAMTTALNLNYNDHIGQMNNLVANSRELVFNSRVSYNNSAENCPHLTGLANRFLAEARQGADFVEQARQGLVAITLTNIRTSLQTQAKNIQNIGVLPWSKATMPEIVNVRLGSFKDVESNVLAPTGNDQLLKLDTKSGYIDSASNLYYGNASLHLPEDPDKNFYLTSLSAPVNGVIAPAKLTSPENFLRSLDLIKNGKTEHAVTCQQLPTAVQIDMQTNVKNLVVIDITNGLTVNATVATNGAYPTQQ